MQPGLAEEGNRVKIALGVVLGRVPDPAEAGLEQLLGLFLGSRIVLAGAELDGDPPPQCSAVGHVGQTGGRNLEMGEPVSVDPLPRDDAEVSEPLDERADGVAGEVAGAEERAGTGRRVEAVVAACAEPLRFVHGIMDPSVRIGSAMGRAGKALSSAGSPGGRPEGHAARRAAL